MSWHVFNSKRNCQHFLYTGESYEGKSLCCGHFWITSNHVYLVTNTRSFCFILSGNHRKTTGLTSSSAFHFYTCISRTYVIVRPVRLPAWLDTHSVAPSVCIWKCVLSVITVTLQQPLNGGILLRSNTQLCRYCVPYFTGPFPDIKIM
jgi:hypothetical protein